MNVIRLTTENWKQGEYPLRIDSPSWQVIENAIRNLDGHDRTAVRMEVSDDEALQITGGYSGYMVELMLHDSNTSLIDPSRSRQKTAAVLFNEQPSFTEYMVVDLVTALRAAKTLYDRGELDPKLNWEKH